MKSCVLFNPVAGGSRAAEFRDRISGLGGEFEFRETTAAGAARIEAGRAVEEGFGTLVAVGGDGTFNEVLNGVAQVPGALSRVRLGLLPLGTANVFAKELGLPLDLDASLEILRSGRERRVDLAVAGYREDGRPAERYFAQLGGAGLDVQAIEAVDWESKKRFGSLAYLGALFRAMGRVRRRLTLSNGEETLHGELVLIGNGRYYGGRFEIFPGASLCDGLLHAAVFEGIRWSRLAPLGWGILARGLARIRGVRFLRGRRFRMESRERDRFQLEGELAGDLPCEFRILPGQLRVAAPPVP